MNRSIALRARSLVHSLGWVAALLLSLSFTAVQAQTPDDDALDADPPDRAVRLSYIQGDVSLQPAGEEEWATAVVNRPLTTGDKLWTEDNARVEMYVGGAAVRLSGDTGFSFLNVDDDTIQMRITAGVMDVRVRSLDANDHIEIDTPNLALSLLRPGKYRVEVNDEGDATVVKVSEGEAEASGSSLDTVVHSQQAVTFTGTDRVVAQNGSLGAPDAFDSWSLERDRRDQVALTSKTAQYVDPEVTGYEDLEDNGSWSSEPEYGYVWYPTHVAVDWSPYRYGHWVWVRPWGWTWVDDAPWGYAPFHYGRWARVRERWCWVPGPRHVRPVYAPALVGWVGSPGVDVSITIGGGAGVAWFPLGPREVYVPARRYSPRYVERVNVTNTVIVNKTYITNVYEGRARNVTYRNRGAVTAVTRTTFTSAQPVGRNVVRIDEREVTRVGVRGAAPRIQPVRESVLGARRVPDNWRKPPATVVDRQVVVKREPPRREQARFVRNPDTAERRPDRSGDNRNDRRDDARTVGRDRNDARDQNDRRNDARDQADRTRDQADRDRDGLREQTERERAERQAQTDRDRAQRGQAGDTGPGARRDRDVARDDANRDQTRGDQADRAARIERDAQQARDAQNRDRDQRNGDQRDRNADRRDPDQTNENRPAQARMRTDRPPRIPDHINRGNATDRPDRDQQDRDRQQQAQDRQQQAQQDRDRQQQDRQAQQERDRQQAQDAERQARANRDSDERDRQSQLDSKRQIDVQRDRQQAQQERDQARDNPRQGQQDRQREAQQAQDNQRRQQELQAQQDRQQAQDPDRQFQQERDQREAQDRGRQQAQDRGRQQAQDNQRRQQELQAQQDRQQAQDRDRQFQQERDQREAQDRARQQAQDNQRQQQERQLQQDRQREAQQAREQAQEAQRQQQERQAQDRERQMRMERDQQQAQDRARQQQERDQQQAQDRAREQQERQQAQMERQQQQMERERQMQAMRDQQQQQRERERQMQDQQRQQAQQQAQERMRQAQDQQRQQAQQQVQQERMRQAQADRDRQQQQAQAQARAEAQRSRQAQQQQPQQGGNDRNDRNDRGGRRRPNDAPDR